MKQNYDFIEIGTSCFLTLVEVAGDNTYGLSIEPIQEYLDKLPNKPHVTKICGAVVADEDSAGLDIYYVDEKDIDSLNLGKFLKGCNCVGRPHDMHLEYWPNPIQWHATPNRKGLATVNLVEKGLVKIKRVPCYTYKYLMDTYNIGSIQHLKIDTEGYDCKILGSVIKYYKENNLLNILPRRISFESNTHTKESELTFIYDLLAGLGYKCSRTGEDSEAVLK